MMTRTLFVVLGILSLATCAFATDEYLLKETSRRANGDTHYSLQHVDFNASNGVGEYEDLVSFKTDKAVFQFVFAESALYALTKRNELIVVARDGSLTHPFPQDAFRAMSPGPNGSIFLLPVVAGKDFFQFMPDGSSKKFSSPSFVNSIAWNGQSNELEMIAESNNFPIGNYAHLGFDLNKTYKLKGKLELDNSQLYSSPIVRSFQHDLAFVEDAGSYFLVTMSATGSEHFPLPASLSKRRPTILKSGTGPYGVRWAWVRSENDLYKLTLDKGVAKLVLGYPGAFDDKHLTEVSGVKSHFNYADVENMNSNNFLIRLTRRKFVAKTVPTVADAAPAAQQTAPEISRDERVRTAVRDEIKRLADKLRYMGFANATLSSADFVRALDQAGGDAFWKNSLFAEIPTDELTRNPVTLDELVDVLAAKLPAAKICSLNLTTP